MDAARFGRCRLRTTLGTIVGKTGDSQRHMTVAVIAPPSCASKNNGASLGRMPANVSLAARANVTAGLANEVEDVNQYALVM